ncbi:MAG TPA: C39 family peptidase [Gammaproteobacteria bacterium]|nr:C39 family peptidase [Gammaproteobacteria bacterium]
MTRLVPAVVVLLGWMLLPAGPARALPPTFAGGAVLHMSVTSMAERKWERTFPQKYDFSCGSASVATLLTYHYDKPTRPEDVFKTMYQHGDQKKIRAQGFSMLDLKRYLDYRGLNAAGFRMDLDALEKIGAPAIALVNTRGYRHFVVIKGIRGNEVLVGDPAGGAAIVTKQLMESIWSGIVLAGRTEVALARSHFNDPKDWAMRPSPMLGDGMRGNGIGSLTLSLPGLNEFGR